MIDKVLPDKAGVLLAAALRLYPDASDTEARQPFVAKALVLLEAKSGRLEPAEMRVKALVHQALDQPEEAVASYRRLLRREPRQVEWRFEFARYLHTIHKLDESRRELVIVLNQDPHHGLARDLLEIVMRDLLRRRSDERPATREEE